MNERETELLTASDIEVIKRASISTLQTLELDREAIVNIWGCITAEQERLSEKKEQKEAAKR